MSAPPVVAQPQLDPVEPREREPETRALLELEAVEVDPVDPARAQGAPDRPLVGQERPRRGVVRPRGRDLQVVPLRAAGPRGGEGAEDVAPALPPAGGEEPVGVAAEDRARRVLVEVRDPRGVDGDPGPAGRLLVLLLAGVPRDGGGRHRDDVHAVGHPLAHRVGPGLLGAQHPVERRGDPARAERRPRRPDLGRGRGEQEGEGIGHGARPARDADEDRLPGGDPEGEPGLPLLVRVLAVEEHELGAHLAERGDLRVELPRGGERGREAPVRRRDVAVPDRGRTPRVPVRGGLDERPADVRRQRRDRLGVLPRVVRRRRGDGGRGAHGEDRQERDHQPTCAHARHFREAGRPVQGPGGAG
jgi:hypothetical protein